MLSDLVERTCVILNIREMTKEQLAEESMIDIAYAVLAEKERTINIKTANG